MRAEAGGGAPFGQHVLQSADVADADDSFDKLLFIDEAGECQWDEVRFQLMWIEHGGSGFGGMNWEQVNELDVVTIGWLLNRMLKQRHDEAEAIKRGARGK